MYRGDFFMSGMMNDQKRMWKAVLIGTITSVILTVLLTCVFAFVVKLMPVVPYGIIDYVLIGLEGLSVLIGAYIASSITKSKGLMIGAICAITMFVILTISGMSIPNNDIGVLTVIRVTALLVCGVIGGIAGVNRKEKVHIK